MWNNCGRDKKKAPLEVLFFIIYYSHFTSRIHKKHAFHQG